MRDDERYSDQVVDNNEPEDWLTVLECRFEAELSSVQAILQSAGVDFVIDDQYMGRNEPWLRLVGGITSKVRVPVSQCQRARDILFETGMLSATPSSTDFRAPFILKVVFTVFILIILWSIISML